MIIEKLKEYLNHPLTRKNNIDSPEAGKSIEILIRKKPFLNQIYQMWYKIIKNELPGNLPGKVLELGSGSGFLREFIPDLVTSEILNVPNVDILLDGRNLPFPEESLGAIVMVDVLHHLPSAEKFFREASYCVKGSGRIVMIEPWTTRWSSFVYKYLHHEPFDPGAADWDFPEGGPLSQANSALPWIIFSRDREKFEKCFPKWKIIKIELHSPFAYLLSGGVSMISLLPGRMFKVCRNTERMMAPWMDKLAMFSTIVLEHSNKSGK